MSINPQIEIVCLVTKAIQPAQQDIDERADSQPRDFTIFF